MTRYRLFRGKLREHAQGEWVRAEDMAALLAPFVAVARGIPDNWPERCQLRVDSGFEYKTARRYEYLAYHGADADGRNIDCDGLLPTISQWRALKHVMEAIQ